MIPTMFKAFLIMVTVATPLQAKAWRGIIPLHSTRADVERLLGAPSINRSNMTFYDFERERVSIDYATGPCGTESSIWNVPRDTVASIWVTPKPNQLKFTDLKLDKSKYKGEKDKEVQYIINYINEEEGISYQVDTNDDSVTLIKYFPAAKDAYLRCPSSGDDLERTTKFDSYSNISFEAETQRLDSFAEQVRRYASTQAYIMAYAGRRARAGEAKTRAERAKEYLVKQRGIDPERITVIDGGYQEEPVVELYLVPPGAHPPLPAPTVDPREVEIIKVSSTMNYHCTSRSHRR